MAENRPQTQADTGAISGTWNAFQLTLGGLRMPIAMHLAFDALAGLCVTLLGHPVMAAVLFASSAIFDIAQQHVIRRWIAVSDTADPVNGVRKLAVLCFVRMVVYLTPTLAMVMTGG